MNLAASEEGRRRDWLRSRARTVEELASYIEEQEFSRQTSRRVGADRSQAALAAMAIADYGLLSRLREEMRSWVDGHLSAWGASLFVSLNLKDFTPSEYRVLCPSERTHRAPRNRAVRQAGR